MGKHPIQVFGRLKPMKAQEKLGVDDYYVKSEEDSPDVLILTHKPSNDPINNKPESHNFRFKKVFEQHVTQATVFEKVAMPVVDSVLQGYNGTIFAYGQTGSGKTFSITGGTVRPEDRGIIPRTVEYVFERVSQPSEFRYKVFVSYLEIYNESGYDLLNPDHQINKMEDLARVILLEDERGCTHLRNLALHEAKTKQQVLELLYQGDVNRVIAETPMNPNSSRSHCIFTIHLEIQKPLSSVVRHSKLNLVDLAGSERVYKSGLDGRILQQAKQINLSLHYLEQVIVALSEQDRSHIPYRNCMMTTVLKDTLGGNCLTTMIATLSLAQNAVEETVSTCRFAQRVALICNDAKVNEEFDHAREIAMLRQEVTRLRKQLEMSNEVTKVRESLSPEEITDCRRLVREFTACEDFAEFPEVPNDVRKVKQCFLVFKESLRGATRRDTPLATTDTSSELGEQLEVFRERIRQRDMEISILLTNIKELKDTMAKMQSTKKQSGFCADELRLNLDSASHASLVSNGLEVVSTGHPSHRSNRTEPDTATRIYERYSPEERQAFAMFVSEQHSTRANVKALKSKLRLKSQECKELASRAERSHEKSHSLMKMLDDLKSDPSLDQRGSDYEIGLNYRISQEEAVRRDVAIRIREARNEIVDLREEIEREKMQLVTTFEEWKLAAAADDRDVVETASQVSMFDEDNRSVSSCATEITSRDFECEQLLSPVTAGSNGTNYDELKIGMGDIHSRKPYRFGKQGINYSNLILIPTDDSHVENTSITLAQSSGRSSSGTLHRQDHVMGAVALAELRELKKGMDETGRLENKNAELGTKERDLSSGRLEKPFSAASSESEIVTPGSDVGSLQDDQPKYDKFYKSTCQTAQSNQYLQAQKDNDESDESNIEIDAVLTGDPEVDEEVINFYKARNKLFL